ncbi:DMT family transporter [Nocardia sp. alder85J]|uniref:DMT family transporter n=1 Tax=Nocardia sp. alder85J TaxID=2862949 RepID=UPI001CD24564|nr:DMT family transporter [Nocardia sp. alder85J]MCX4097120.1 DMT family transporter [Nocardia sp. alder85J]
MPGESGEIGYQPRESGGPRGHPACLAESVAGRVVSVTGRVASGARTRWSPVRAPDLLAYATMTTVWGASYFFTAIALRSFSPMMVVFGRMAIATMVLGGVAWRRRPPRPTRRIMVLLCVFGLCNVTLPYTLITVAQTHLPSALTGVLSATTPIFVFLVAGPILRTERVTPGRAAGVLLAFTGIALLHPPGAGGGRLWPLVAVAGSLVFAIGNVATGRYLAGVDPLVIATGQIGSAAILSALPAATIGTPIRAVGPAPALALLELGLFASALAYLLYFRFILRWGSTATSFNTYLQPIVGLTLGLGLLGETITGRQWAALGSILAGLALFVARDLRTRPGGGGWARIRRAWCRIGFGTTSAEYDGGPTFTPGRRG